LNSNPSTTRKKKKESRKEKHQNWIRMGKCGMCLGLREEKKWRKDGREAPATWQWKEPRETDGQGRTP
jgi:hypothetical protein